MPASLFCGAPNSQRRRLEQDNPRGLRHYRAGPKTMPPYAEPGLSSQGNSLLPGRFDAFRLAFARRLGAEGFRALRRVLAGAGAPPRKHPSVARMIATTSLFKRGRRNMGSHWSKPIAPALYSTKNCRGLRGLTAKDLSGSLIP